MSDVSIPPELLDGILSQLPVISLLRFRCVSKLWRALIDSKDFINLHLNQSIKTNTNLNLIFGVDNTFYYLDLDSSTEVLKKVDHPLHSKYPTAILGSCNGLICSSTLEIDNIITFWNPYTRKFKIIPSNFDLVGESCVYGFGYDHVNDDYKLVRLVYAKRFSRWVKGSWYDYPCSRMAVYSLKLGEWRNAGDFPYYLCPFSCFNVFVHGALHWLVSENPGPQANYDIVAFDLTNEVFRLVPWPEFLDQIAMVNLAVLGESLCMVCYTLQKSIDIWVMKSYGVKESWIKLISTVDTNVMPNFHDLRPVKYSKCGGELLLVKDFERLIWYDLEKETVRETVSRPDSFAVETFVGSLVQVTDI